MEFWTGFGAEHTMLRRDRVGSAELLLPAASRRASPAAKWLVLGALNASVATQCSVGSPKVHNRL